jgi:phage/plasmid-associated DNA primase
MDPSHHVGGVDSGGAVAASSSSPSPSPSRQEAQAQAQAQAQQQQSAPGFAQLPSLSQFLNAFRVERGCDHTHTSFAKPSGAFYLPGAQHEMFMRIYKSALARGEDLHLTEHHRHIGPVVVDLDFRFEVDADDAARLQAGGRPRRRHGEPDVRAIVGAYCHHVAYYCDVPAVVDVYVTEKPNATVAHKTLVKDGLHLVIPNVVTQPAVQLLVRRDALKQLAAVLRPLNLANRIDDVVDEAVIERNNWMLYGSRKPAGEVYTVTRHYRWRAEDETIEEVPVDPSPDAADAAQFVELLSIRNKYEETPTRLARADDVDAFVRAADEARRRRLAVEAVMHDDTTDASPSRQNTCENLDLVNRLVAILSPARIETYNDWIRMGWCLRNIDHRLLETWVDVSRKSPKYMEGECPRLWRTMRQGRLGIGTLHMWARHDAPEQYRDLMRADLHDLIVRCVNSTHYDVASVVHHLYRYQYVCSSLRNRTWYEFRDHRWRESDSAVTLRQHVSSDVYKEFCNVASAMALRAASASDETEQKRLGELAQRVAAVSLKLKTTSFKENVIKECSEMFYREGFENRLDSDVYLLGFENGIYDLSRGEFREGHPDDYVSFSTGNNYVPYNENTEAARDIKRFWSQVHPDPEMREYVLKTIASCLCGHVREERFNIWTGSGCHALGTRIVMRDGSTKAVEDIAIGEQLMGDDSTPRTVQQLFRGHADMWRVKPTKGESFVVNGDHVLSLKMKNTSSVCYRAYRPRLPWMARWFVRSLAKVAEARGKCFKTKEEAVAHLDAQKQTDPDYLSSGSVIDVTVHDYLANIKHIGERNMFLYRPDFVEFPERPTHPALDPYVLGVWLGDGTTRSSQITNMDAPIVDRVRELLPKTVKMTTGKQAKGLARTYTMGKADGFGTKWQKNDITIALESYGLLGNKHIPLDYRCNTREVRMQVLAGLLDTDGSYQAHCNQFTLIQKVERVMDDAIALARSLGFACYKRKIGTYYRTHIVGAGIEDIPTALTRKTGRTRVKVKDVRRVGFKLERVEDGDFYGFELDGNHRYLAADYVVLHNSNSKSVCCTLIEKALGQYCCKFPVTMLTQKRAASGAATPEIARAKGRRFAVLQEPSEDERLNVGLMKEMSGGDVIQTRELFKAPVEWKPQFKLFLLCNQLPNVPSDDGGTWRRIRVVEFGSKFVERPNPDAPNEFPVDYELSNKLEGWREAFLGMLVDVCYKAYANAKLHEPYLVMQCTRDYQRNNDFMADFVDSCLERQPPPPPPRQGDLIPAPLPPYVPWMLSVDDAYHEYREWIKADAVAVKPKKGEMKSYLDRTFGKGAGVQGRHTWRGLRVRIKERAIFDDDDM